MLRAWGGVGLRTAREMVQKMVEIVENLSKLPCRGLFRGGAAPALVAVPEADPVCEHHGAAWLAHARHLREQHVESLNVGQYAYRHHGIERVVLELVVGGERVCVCGGGVNYGNYPAT